MNIYEQNQLMIIQEFVNLNISRSILIDLVLNIANNHWKMFTKMHLLSIKFSLTMSSFFLGKLTYV